MSSSLRQLMTRGRSPASTETAAWQPTLARAVTRAPPHVRSNRSTPRLVLWYAVATLPLMLIGQWGMDDSTALIARTFQLIIALITAWAWEHLFARRRDRRHEPTWLVSAWLFVLLLPAGTPLWLVAVALSFGLIFGHYIFGGLGRSLVNPALLSALFVQFSYPGITAATDYSVSGDPLSPWSAFVSHTGTTLASASALGCLIGAVCLVRVGAASPRTLLGALAGVAATATLLNIHSDAANPAALPWHWHLVLGNLTFGVVFLATDPSTAALTRGGRWIHGAMIGVVTVLIRELDPTHPDGALFAILLAGLTVPLVDYLIVRLHINRRESAMLRNGG